MGSQVFYLGLAGALPKARISAILSISLVWRAEPQRSWHLTAAAVHVLLGTSNLVFWQIFIVADMLAMGWVTAVLHWLFVALQLAAAAPTYSRLGS